MNYWSNVADLFSGLMIIFLFISIGVLIDVNKDAENLKKDKESFETVLKRREAIRQEIYSNLENEFSRDFKRWNASLDKDLSIRFSNPDILFAGGSSDLNKKYKDILDDFFPRYMSILLQYNQEIDYIALEGHTSSHGWMGCTGDCSYFRNMDLSQKRSLNTLRYCWDLSNEKDFIMKKFIATGMSYSKRIENEDGNGYNESDSKRVEFVIKIKSDLYSSDTNFNASLISSL